MVDTMSSAQAHTYPQSPFSGDVLVNREYWAEFINAGLYFVRLSASESNNRQTISLHCCSVVSIYESE